MGRQSFLPCVGVQIQHMCGKWVFIFVWFHTCIYDFQEGKQHVLYIVQYILYCMIHFGKQSENIFFLIFPVGSSKKVAPLLIK